MSTEEVQAELDAQAALRERWAAALESGGYKQSKGNLRTKDGYCCLGVLCDLVKDEIDASWIKYAGDFYYFSLPEKEEDEVRQFQSTLPLVVQKMVGVRDSLVRVDTSDKDYSTLAHVNDRGASFETIAQLIRNNYKF